MLDRHSRVAGTLLLAFWLAACGGDDEAPADDRKADSGDRDRQTEEASAGRAAIVDDSQTPPQGVAAIEAWLEAGDYKSWSCEPSVHPSRAPSPHGFNRICSNDLISTRVAGSDDWPAGAAAVKELYASASASSPAGYAVYLKTSADSAGGANWYWYERVPIDSSAPHDGQGIVADGMGDSGPEKTICVGCHVAAGADEAHTPTEGARDQVYTPVQ